MRAQATNVFGERFTVLRTLGEGGMGVVYEAIDHQREVRVALKTMREMDPAALYRFKNEFRALADVTHPNLVALHELVAEKEVTFFTMEYVEGVDFLQHVRVGAELAFAKTFVRPMEKTDEGHIRPPSAFPPAANAPRPSDMTRLRDALAQLVCGIHAIHAAGKLHRDIKPSNVLVTAEGRVVLLDFGLAVDLHEPGEHGTPHEIAGTAEYMSPEQAGEGDLSEASDWYSVGVMLYEALTGCLPFAGGRLRVLMDKQEHDPPAPGDVVSGVPDELSALCVELLRRDPERRANGDDVLRRLGAPAADRRDISAPTLAAPFVARDRQTAELEAAFAMAKSGRASVTYVHGASGMGKTILVRRFVDDLARRGEAIALSGRCYERELVAYKAFDSIIDALSRYLRGLPREATFALMPREIQTLTRVFPVLLRVEAIAAAPKRAYEIPDPQELRRRAFAALRELVVRMAAKRPLVLWIDDLQWGDVDSAALLTALLRPPDAPPIMLIASYRSEDEGRSAILKMLRDPRTGLHDTRTIEVGPLTLSESTELALALLEGEEAHAQAVAIAHESHGNPLFVDEIARHVRHGGAQGKIDARSVRLADVLHARVAALPEEARRLLEIIAVAGRPIARPVAQRAAQLNANTEGKSIAQLRAAHLVRTVRTQDLEEVESYHDRVRESVAEGLQATALETRHREIAMALLGSRDADPEALAVHFRGAGELSRAGEYAVLAAAKAVEALAFDRAAGLYQLAMELRPQDGEAGRQLRWRLGNALANAGRGAAAAEVYLTAAEGARAADALELRRRAAEELLRCGHVDDGIAAIRGVLQAVGMELPETSRGALASILYHSAYLRVRGLRFKERDASQVSAEDLTRIDVCWSVAAGLGIVDTIRAVDFLKRQLLLALRAGEKYRVARALAMEIVASAAGGGETAKRTAQIATEAVALAERTGNPHARAIATASVGMAAYLEGRWQDALDACTKAEGVLRDHCTGVAWEMATAHTYALWSLWNMGNLRELGARLPVLLAEARGRGDRYLVTNLRTGRVNVVWLAAGDVERAHAEVTEAMAEWSNRHVHLQHYLALFGHAQADLYSGDGASALARIEREWERFRGALLFRIQLPRIEALHLRARASLSAAARAKSGADELVAAAARDASKMEAERMGWAAGLATLVRAGIARAREDDEGAVRFLETAESQLAKHDMRLYAAAACRRRGEAIGGDRGRELVEGADAFMRSEGIVDAARMTEMLAPGFEKVARRSTA